VLQDSPMTRGPVPPFVHTVQCGRVIARLRTQADLTQTELADHCGWSQNKIARIEGGGRALDPDDLDKILVPLNPTDADREHLLTYAEEGRKPVPKSNLRWRFPDEMRKVIDLEASAPRLYGHAEMVLPGLTQTEDYMADLVRRSQPTMPPIQVDEFVALRVARQQVLDNLDQRFEFVIDQAALARMENMGGSSKLMHDQIRKLGELAERPNITIRIVPFSYGPYLGQEVSYYIAEYDLEPGKPAVHLVYIDRYDDLGVLHDDRGVAKYQTLWGAQRLAGLSPEKSLWFLQLLTGSVSLS
jgi:transcriptional regulator with XRE-family HTH domain